MIPNRSLEDLKFIVTAGSLMFLFYNVFIKK